MSCQLRKMKMMAAASCENKSPETACGKEVASKLAQMQAERAKQDQMWTTPVKSEYQVSTSSLGGQYTKSGSIPNGQGFVT